jgi:NADH dehydrogenase
MEDSMKKIIILGAGYAGITAAKTLNKSLKKNEAEITLIDRNPFHTLMTELHELAGGRVDDDGVTISLDRIFAGTRVKRVVDEIKDIDLPQKKLLSQGHEYEYDYLIVATGGDPEYFCIDGVEEHGFPLWSFDHAKRIRRHVEDCFLRASREPDLKTRKNLLHFVVAGAGFTGLDLAGEVCEWKDILASKYRVDVGEVQITVVEVIEKILALLPEKLQKKAEKYLVKRGCTFRLGTPLTSLEPGRVNLDKDDFIESETLIWTCGVQGGEFAQNMASAKAQSSMINKDDRPQGSCEDGNYIVGRRNRLKVKDTLQSPDSDEIFVTGDILCYEQNDRPVPQIVETAVQSAETAAHNVKALIRGTNNLKSFNPKYHGFMVSLGGRYAVAHLMGWLSLSGFFAMATKHLVNLIHFWQVAGFNQCWSYLRHEILDIKQNRSLVHGLLSTKVRGHWVAVMRIFVGVMWLIEGITKILNGWLQPGNIFIIPIDGASAASEAADGAVAAIQPFLFAEPVGIYNWMVVHIISGAPFLFQATVVLLEIAIGLALIGGLFTFLASLASIGLCLMFTLSAQAEPSILWFFFSGILFLGGAGRGTGLDHWVMPWLGNLWSRWGWVKRSNLYLGEPDRGKKL